MVMTMEPTVEVKATRKVGRPKNGVVPDPDVVVSRTTRYEQFVYDPRNRPIDWDHVQELFDSVCENNLLEDFPIVVQNSGDSLVVLDGQHRLEVAKILECPIFYKISPNMTFADVHRINNAHQSWNNANYLNRWLREGKIEYRKFRSFVERYPHIGQNFALGLCMIGGSKLVRQSFRNGTYVCDNLEAAEKLGEVSKSLEPYAKDFWTHTYFLVALRALLANPRYDHATMLRKLDYLSTRMVKCPDHRAYLDMLLDIYNFKSRGPALTMEGVSVKANARAVVPHG